jgi:DNA-binding NarL/FixJ family response regulator
MLGRGGDRGWGVLVEDASTGEIAAALVAISRGLVVLPAAIARRLGRVSAIDDTGDAGIAPLQETLTAREREVLELVSQGLSNKAIASHLGISGNTVKFHVSSICGKLGASSRTEAVRLGVRRGLVSL